jgi:hypothetical protein
MGSLDRLVQALEAVEAAPIDLDRPTHRRASPVARI